MTNNLKILTILSIFVLILTGYFCFFSSFTKNQIIVNNNNEKKDGKDTNINNEDSNNNEDNENSKLSILGVVIFIILIIIIVVIVFIIVDKFKFEFNEESKEDFAKKKFCPTFFLINPSLLEGEDKDNAQENGEYFFKILIERIFPKNEIKNIKSVTIYLDTDDYNGLNNGECTTSLRIILEKIAEFAAFTKSATDDIKKIIGSLSMDENDLYAASKSIEDKYGEEFDSYLCSYLLYYLAKNLDDLNKSMFTATNDPNKKSDTYNTFAFQEVQNQKEYHVNYSVMDKILDKLNELDFKESLLDNMIKYN